MLDDSAAVKGFVFASAEQCGGKVQFNGEYIDFDLSLVGIVYANISNLSLN